MNLVDSCGWLEYFANGKNASFFAPFIEDEARLLVPIIVVVEVTRRLSHLLGEQAASAALVFMRKGSFVSLDAEGMFKAACMAHRHKLAMVDGRIWQSAQANDALVYTQDGDFDELPGVVLRARQ